MPARKQNCADSGLGDKSKMKSIFLTQHSKSKEIEKGKKRKNNNPTLLLNL